MTRHAIAPGAAAVVLCVSLLLGAGPASAADAAGVAPPGAVVRETVDAVVAVLGDASLNAATKRRQVRKIIGAHFDYAAMSNRVLATNWSKASDDQRRRFTALFRDLLSHTYWRKISGYSNETVEYTGEQLRGDKLATVRTLILTDTADIPVDYKLYRRHDGWMAYDVVIEQVSLVRNYRTRFHETVHRAGLDGLLGELEVRVAEASVAGE